MSHISKDLYDKIGKKYSDNRKKATNDVTELPTVLELLGDIKGKKLLDIGCGLGIHAQAFIDRGALITGFDVSEEMINKCKERCGEKGNFFVADYENTELEADFYDVVNASVSLNYTASLDEVLKRIYVWLREDGVFTFSVPHPVWLLKRVNGMDYSYAHEIKIFMKSYDVEITNYYRPLGEYLDLLDKNKFKLLKLVETTIPKDLEGYPEEKYRLPNMIVFKLMKT